MTSTTAPRCQAQHPAVLASPAELRRDRSANPRPQHQSTSGIDRRRHVAHCFDAGVVCPRARQRRHGLCSLNGAHLSLQGYSPWSRYIQGAAGTKSSLTVPLLLGDEVIGTLNIESPKKDAFTETDVFFTEAFAREIVQALHTLELLAVEKSGTALASVEAVNREVALPADEISTRRRRSWADTCKRDGNGRPIAANYRQRPIDQTIDPHRWRIRWSATSDQRAAKRRWPSRCMASMYWLPTATSACAGRLTCSWKSTAAMWSCPQSPGSDRHGTSGEVRRIHARHSLARRKSLRDLLPTA